MPVKTTRRNPQMYALIKETREKRSKLAHDASGIVLKAREEKREMSSEEQEQFDKITDDLTKLDARVTKLEKLEEDENENDDVDNGNDDSYDDDNGDDSERAYCFDGEYRNEDERNERRERADDEMRRYGRNGANRSDNDNRRSNRDDFSRNRRYNHGFDRSDARNNPTRGSNRRSNTRLQRRDGENHWQYETRCRRESREYAEAFVNYLKYGNAVLHNSRALQADDDLLGGYLVMPETIVNKILKKVDNILYMQQKCEVMNVENAQSLGVPSLENDPDEADWTTEIKQINQDLTMSFGKRQLTPFPIRKRLLVSERWLRLALSASFMSNDDQNGAGGSPENIVINRLAYRLATPKEKAIFTGNGVGKPLGIFTASSRGISTARDVLTGSATNLTYTGLVNAKMQLKVQYQNTAEWFFHRDAVSKIMQLVDSNGRPLLNFQTLPDMPTTLLQRPLNMSEYVPNTFTTGSYVGIIGDPKFYVIANSMQVTVKKAEELYAETGQVGFFIAHESDGMPFLEEAWARLKTN